MDTGATRARRRRAQEIKFILHVGAPKVGPNFCIGRTTLGMIDAQIWAQDKLGGEIVSSLWASVSILACCLPLLGGGGDDDADFA